jgi:cellulose synthase operon protein B
VSGAARVALTLGAGLALVASAAAQARGRPVTPADSAIEAAREAAGAAEAAAREAAAAQAAARDAVARERESRETDAAAPAPAAPTEPSRGTRTVDATPTDAQRASAAPVLEVPFVARADEDIAAARIDVALARAPARAPAAALEVLVDDERVALVPLGVAVERVLDVDPDLVAARNTLALRLLDRAGRPIARAGAWRVVRTVRIVLETTPASLPNDLALLPLPFLDPGFDASATVPVVLGAAPDPERIRLAALVAGRLALDAPVPLSFEVRLDSLPETRAVVLLAGAAEARRLGLDPPAGPSIRMIDHPRHPGSNVKLLVVAGRDAGELSDAVQTLAARTQRLVGPEVPLPPSPAAPPAPPYSAPRWIPSGRAVAFADYPQGGTPGHDGTRPATLPVRFRVSPDLWIWPTEHVVLDLGWRERLPPGVPAPRLDVELNGYFLATLPASGGPGDSTRHVRLRVPREHMRGFNELDVHVRYPDDAVAPAGEAPYVGVLGDSVLHLEGMSHFAVLPDVALFALDGFPFTRLPDLGDTAIVLPASPAPEEVGEVLTLAARLAQITGRAGTRATFLAGDPPDAALAGKDVLVVGALRRLPLLARWRALLPLSFGPGGAHVQRSPRVRPALELAGGIGAVLDRRRAARVLASERPSGAIMGIESPVARGRAAYFVTGAPGLPPFRSFLGYAESRSLASNDLLLVAGGRRWMFRVGPSFGSGALDGWTALRWFLSNHWMLLLPVLAVGVAVLARLLHRAVAERMRARIALEGVPQ